MAILGRLRERLRSSASRLGDALASLAGNRPLDAATLEELENILISADLGVGPAAAITRGVGRRLRSGVVDGTRLRLALAEEIIEILEPVAVTLPEREVRPRVILFVGVNGSGKTTSIGKLAAKLRGQGQRVLLAACDTFRAAAVEQLMVWAERAGVEAMTARAGADPAGLAFDAHARAMAEGFDALLVDTAGRQHNRRALMDELAKVRRVLGKQDSASPHDVLLVLDASVGQNTLAQVDAFGSEVGVTGIIMTKLDGSARGGTLVAVAERSGLPVHAIGIGESIDDLGPFDAREFAAAITAMDEGARAAS